MEALKLYTDFSCVSDVLIGDCYSSDGTEKLITAYDFVTEVYKVPYGNVAKNMWKGVQLSKGDYIIKIDSDILASKDWNRKALTVLQEAERHGIRIVGYDLGDRVLWQAGTGNPIELGDSGFAIQPMKYVGGRMITTKALFFEQNAFGRFGEIQGQYNGWWQWHQGFRGQIGAMLPRLACFDMARIENVPPGFKYISERRGEPIVERLIQEDPLQLKRQYVSAGWMRDHD